ncbi:hypothetical protein GCM10023115_17500 [Pontixanthobacter gangjinensis]|uniref:DUF805 domain-containing protein n=1 Tax=Pontixanthobacter gangjinensis TaxID=1028742 RepID=A0A6I4SMJ6_9SPHN|nr:DUF805 domain-containing protein [Pontixanthobacter gangjinensis]MXO56995.1 DUF805 domain-containing protein [Pontixanthobacter gangjinensis]
MFRSIGYNLKHLLDFKGRDGRTVFWFYFLFVVLLNVIILIATVAPAFLSIIGEIAATGAQTGNSAALEAAALEKMIGIGLPTTLVKTSLAIAAMNIILLSASFVRRAHDSGLPGMLLVIPLGLQLVWMYFSYSQLGGLDKTMRAAIEAREANLETGVQVGMIAQDLLGWLAVLIVIVIGILKTQQGSNQYGEAAQQL